jgi:enamine deaminase RidA (YjgF/YER057c/UK114 family)
MKQFLLLTIFSVSISTASMAQDPEKKLKELKIVLPEIKMPAASFVHAVRTGNLLFLSGKGPTGLDGVSVKGKVGQDVTIEEGIAAARLVAINQIAVLKKELGDLKKVKRIVKVLGMVNCEGDFTAQSQVINGFSDLMVAVFGEKGKHARSAVGMSSLPGNIAVEVELIVEVED